VIVVERLCFLALKEHLADKVERVRTAVEATVSSVEVSLWLLRNCLYLRVVIACVIKHKVTNFARANTKLLQDC
jgi:hypothetical protein